MLQSIPCDNLCLLVAEDGKLAAKKAEDSRELAIQARDASRTLQSLSTEVPNQSVAAWLLPVHSASGGALEPGRVCFLSFVWGFQLKDGLLPQTRNVRQAAYVVMSLQAVT